MANVAIKRLHLENYKSIKDITVDFTKTTEIRGKNAVGKSTISGAILETLTGKLPNGAEATDEILRPVVNGIRVDRVPIVRELTIMIDGQEHILRKESVQKWTRHRGETEETFNGCENHYAVDGYDYREKDYLAWLNDHVCDTDKLLYCMNPAIFLNTLSKSTADARMALEKASGFSIENFIAEKPQYADIDKLTSGQPIEKAIKKYRADLNAQKKVLTSAQNNLAYEQNRKIEDLPVDDIADLEKQIEETKGSLNFVTAQNKAHSETLFKLDVLRGQLESEKRKAKEEEQKSMDSAMKMVLSLQEAIHNTDRELEHKCFDGNSIKSQIASLELQKKDAEQSLKEAEESKPNENQFICEYCGQMMPVDKVAEANAKFEAEKKKSIEGYKGVIGYLNRTIEDNNRKFEEVKECIEQLNAKKPVFKDEYAKALNAHNQMKSMPFPIPEEVARLEAEIADLEIKLKSVAGYDTEIDVGTKHLEELIFMLNKAKTNSKTNEVLHQNHIDSINQLTESVKSNAQTCATLEGIIDKLQMFGRQKNEKLAELVNPNFSYLHFSFVGYTQDGSPYDDCKIVSNFDSIEYRNTNHGYRLLTEMDLVNGLQKLNGVTLPIICDDTESLDSDRIPKFDNQLILIRRTDDDGINVKEI